MVAEGVCMSKKTKSHITFDQSKNNRSNMNFMHVNKKGKASSFNKVHNTKNK